MHALLSPLRSQPRAAARARPGRLLALVVSIAAIVATAAPLACSPEVPTPGPEARCADACTAKAHACTAAQCARGCRFVLDKLVEHEGAQVLACIARPERKRCDDFAFAECAALTGPYVDGGPAPPRPPSDDDQP